MPARLPCTYKVRSELLLRRERCHHHTVRVCDAALLVRFDPVWCTFASSVHQAASTRPVRERWRGHVECSVSTFYSVYHEQDTFISIRATTARSYHHSLTDVTRDAHSTVSALDAANQTCKQKGKARRESSQRESIKAARGRLLPHRESRAVLWRAGSGELGEPARAPTNRIGARCAPAPAKDAAPRSAWTGWMLSLLPAHTGGKNS